jgi:sulfur-carrier protein adenylyltransferase/sulfurtransferase
MDAAAVFQSIPSLSADAVKDLLSAKGPGACNLIDVRQPGEYEQGHIPGAHLIPLGEVAARVNEIDRTRPTVLYCRSGNRSRAAAAVLLDAGFSDALSMDGGIQAWKGLVAGGPPEAGKAYFSGKERPEELIALAWSLEEGSRRFYAAMASTLAGEAAALFEGLVKAEDHHKAALVGVYREVSGDTAAASLPAALFGESAPGDVMEGGISVRKAVEWTNGKGVNDVLDLAIALEAHAYDLYLKMERAVAGEGAKRIFQVLAAEERVHLERMAALLENRRFPGSGKS